MSACALALLEGQELLLDQFLVLVMHDLAAVRFDSNDGEDLLVDGQHQDLYPGPKPRRMRDLSASDRHKRVAVCP